MGIVWRGIVNVMMCVCVADTRFRVEDIEGALLKQLKAAREPGIVVKKPEEDNISFSNYGNPSSISGARLMDVSAVFPSVKRAQPDIF